MNKTRPKLFSCLFLFVLYIEYLVNGFQFKYIQVVFNPSVMNEVATYQFSLNRQIDKDFIATNWKNQPIPANSKVKIAFPNEYTLSQLTNYACSYVFLDNNPAISFTCSLNSATKVIQIEGLFPSNANISLIDVEILNIVNPSPSITTQPFMSYLGNDYSANDSKSSIAFDPAELSAFKITFDDPTVNTTSDMILSLHIKNYFPVGGSIQLRFPPTLQWSRDVSFNHLFPIQGTLSCEGVTPNTNSVIYCSGLRSARLVTFTNIASSNITSGQIITFKLMNMFSPPTTETTNPSDALLIRSFDQYSNEINFKESFIQGLKAKVLTSLEVIPISGQADFVVNTWTGLNFTFVLGDTTTNNDYFHMLFPTGTNIIYRTPSSLYRFTASTSFNATNSTLTFFQSTTSPERYAGNNMHIGFISYKAPKSCRVQDVQFKIMKLGYEKMIGTAQIHAQTNKYSLVSIALTQTKINQKTQFKLTLQIKDPLSGKGLILIEIPQKIYKNQAQFSVDVFTSLTSANKMRQSPSFKLYSYLQTIPSPSGNTSVSCGSKGGCLMLSNLIDIATNQILGQNVTLTLSGFKNLEYVQNLDVFDIKTYYDSQLDSKVAQIYQNTSLFMLKTTNGVLKIISLTFSDSSLTFQRTTLIIQIQNQNAIPSNGFIQLRIPTDIYLELSVNSLSQLGVDLLINSVTIFQNQLVNIAAKNQSYSLILDFSTLNLGTLTQISKQSVITLILNNISAPFSKQPLSVSTWYAQSRMNSSKIIDRFTLQNNSNFVYRIVNQNSLSSLSFYRSTKTSANINLLDSTTLLSQNDCQRNAQICGSYIFNINQKQPFSRHEQNQNIENIIRIQIGRNIDIDIISNIYVSIGSQVTFVDKSNTKVYKIASGLLANTAVWIKCSFSIQTTTNSTRILSITLPQPQTLQANNNIQVSTYNRLQLPFPLTVNDIYSSLFILVQNIKNQYSLVPFTMNVKTQKNIENLNDYLYSSGTSQIQKNTQMIDLIVNGFDFSSQYFEAQSNLTIRIAIQNWNQVSSSVSVKSSIRNNVKYLILTLGNSFVFPNIYSVGFCQIGIPMLQEDSTCSIQQISPNFSWTKKINSTSNTQIINMLENSNRLIVFTLSDAFSTALQSSASSDILTLSFGPFANPSEASQNLTKLLKSVSLFTLTLPQNLVHKSLMRVVFQTSCLSPCKQCIFLTNNSDQISSTCKSCDEGWYLYNYTCLTSCPNGTFNSTQMLNDNLTLQKICVDCLPQCQTCTNNLSCDTCSSQSQFKYQYFNITTNTTNCLSICPIQGYYQDVQVDISTNQSQYQCKQCTTNCSMCTSKGDCYKCTGFLILSQSLCIQTCPSGTIQSIKDIFFKNTTVPNVSVCQQCSLAFNDTECVYCNVTQCSACSENFTLDYLKTKKCILFCEQGYFSVEKQLQDQNYTYFVCQACSVQCKTCIDISTYCLSCRWDQNLANDQYYFLNNSCYKTENCPAGLYGNSSARICSLCSDAMQGCLQCISVNNCKKCNLTGGYYLFSLKQLTNSSIQQQNSTTCLIKAQIPKGFILINDTIQKCQIYCSQCSVDVNNCTDCIDGYYLFNLQTGVGTCISQCPDKYYPANLKLCTFCPQPCQNCKLNSTNTSQVVCSSCRSNSSLYYFQNRCLAANQCPQTTYPTMSINNSRICANCLNNCKRCEDDGSSCIDCLQGYYFYQNKCPTKQDCPVGTVGMILQINQTNSQGKCVDCQAGCKSCSLIPQNCTQCILPYYYNPFTNQCLSQCPPPLIQNNITKQCIKCQLPCLTCSNTPTNCTSCQDSYYKFQYTCLTQNSCPQGYFANLTSKICEKCPKQCKQCKYNQQSIKLFCSQCVSPYVLYDNSCLSSCPQNKQFNISGVCLSCSQAIQGCSNCVYLTSSTQFLTSSSQLLCMGCFYPFIFLNNSCIKQCPQSYIYNSETHLCMTPQQNSQQILSQILSNPTIMPLPFTVISGFIFIACIFSKLQNQNSYFIGTVYSLMGIVQTISVVYLILRVMNKQQLKTVFSDSYDTFLLLFLICVGWIYLTNLLASIVQSFLLSSDAKFLKYSSRNFMSFLIISFISLLTNYKFKLIIFTKLFNFSSFKSQLQSVQKFNLINIFSFIGVGNQGLMLYVIGVILSKFTAYLGQQMVLTMVDVAIVTILNLVLAFAVSKKTEDFFQEKYEGITINKKIDVISDQQTHNNNKGSHTSKQGLGEYFISGQKKHGLTSHDNLMHQIQQNDQFSLSISRDEDEQLSQKRSDKSKNIFDQTRPNDDNNIHHHSSQEDQAMKSSTQLKMKTVQNMQGKEAAVQKQVENGKTLDRNSKSLQSSSKTLGNKSQSGSPQKSQKNRSLASYFSPKKSKSSMTNSLSSKYNMQSINESIEKGQRSEQKLRVSQVKLENNFNVIEQQDQTNQKVKQSQFDRLQQSWERQLPQQDNNQPEQKENIQLQKEQESRETDGILNNSDYQAPKQGKSFLQQEDSRQVNKQYLNEGSINPWDQNAQKNEQINIQDEQDLQQEAISQKRQNNGRNKENDISINKTQNVSDDVISHRTGVQTQLIKVHTHEAERQEGLQEQYNRTAGQFKGADGKGLNQVVKNKSSVKQESGVIGSQGVGMSDQVKQQTNNQQTQKSPERAQTIKSHLKSNTFNNFFNQPLEQQLGIKHSSTLLQQKERQLKQLRKSRQKLQEYNKKLNNRSRSRSRSFSKMKQNGSKQDLGREIGKLRKRNQILKQDKQCKQNQSTVSQNKLRQPKQKQPADQNQPSPIVESTYIKKPYNEQINSTSQPANNKIQCDQKPPELITVEQKSSDRNKDQNEQDEKNNIQNRARAINEIGNQDRILSEDKNKLMNDQIMSARYNRTNNRRIRQDQDVQDMNREVIPSNLVMNYQQMDDFTKQDNQATKNNISSQIKDQKQDKQDNQATKNNISSQIKDSKQTNKNALKPQPHSRIDLGQFANQLSNGQLQQQEQAHRFDTNSRSNRRIIDSQVKNNVINQKVRDNVQMLPTRSKLQDTALADRAQAPKLRPPSSDNNIQLSRKRQLPPSDKAASNKANMSLYNIPFYKKSKELNGSQKDDSQVQVSFYNTGQGGYNSYQNGQSGQFKGQCGYFKGQSGYNNGDDSLNSGNNSSRQQQLNTSSNQTSSNKAKYMDRPPNPRINDLSFQQYNYEHQEQNNLNRQPTKPNASNSRVSYSTFNKQYQNDQLSRLISKNSNPSSNVPRRQSLDRGSVTRQNMQMNQSGQARERKQSANSRDLNNRDVNSRENSGRNYTINSNKPQNAGSQQWQHKNKKDLGQHQPQDALQQYYHRGKRQNTKESFNKAAQDSGKPNRSRSKSRERPLSKQSQKKLQTLEKIYLQKLQWKK